VRTDTKHDIRVKEFIVEDASHETPYATTVCPHCGLSNGVLKQMDGSWCHCFLTNCRHLEDVISTDKFSHSVTFIFTKI
jgi:hypothetical protein